MLSNPALPAPHCPQIFRGPDGEPLVLGEGSNGVVFLGRLPGMAVAVKARAAGGAAGLRVSNARPACCCPGAARPRAPPPPPRHATHTSACTPLRATRHPPAQVFELQAGLDSRRAWREAQLLRRCAHERLVPLYGVALAGGLVMLAQRLMEGGSLAQALQAGGTRERLRWAAG